MTDAMAISQYIARARAWGLALDPDDFTATDDGIWLDGMDPGEWIDAVTMD